MDEQVDAGEVARIKRLQLQQRERERRKFAGPHVRTRFTADFEKLWTAFVWVPNDPADVAIGEWVFAGVRRHRNRRKIQTMNKFFAKIRRQFGIDKKSPVKVTDFESVLKLIRDKDQSWRTHPPQFQQRKAKAIQITPRPVGKTTKRRAPRKAKHFDRKRATFIALGKNSWDRKPGYLFCGPLEAVFRSDAVREAERLFRASNEIIVVKVSDLSKSLRNQMHSGKRVKAGVTRVIWPEPVPEFDPLWAKLVKSGKADAAQSDQYNLLHAHWIKVGSPWLSLGWLRKAIKKLTPSTGDTQCAKKKGKAKRNGKVAKTVSRAPLKHIKLSRASRRKLDVRVSAKRRRPIAMRARRAA